MRRLLETDDAISVIAVADDGRDAVEKTMEFLPDVVVMDVSMPAMNGIEATRTLAKRVPGTGVVMLSMHSSADVIREALLAGARGYVFKESVGEEVVRAVKAVAAGRLFIGSGVGEKIVAEYPGGLGGVSAIDSLTSRERETLQLVAEGKSNAEAAAILHLSPRSVETYRWRLMQKLGIEDLPSLVKFAIRHGITTPE